MDFEWGQHFHLMVFFQLCPCANGINCNKQTVAGRGIVILRNKEHKEKVLSHHNFLDSKFVIGKTLRNQQKLGWKEWKIARLYKRIEQKCFLVTFWHLMVHLVKLSIMAAQYTHEKNFWWNMEHHFLVSVFIFKTKNNTMKIKIYPWKLKYLLFVSCPNL